MTNNQKDTIYIDVDDEITTVIDKLRGSPHKIVALVLPKRAAVFQSVVNMKLLKRTAETTKKKIVLITSEAALLPLAGAVGLHVANTLQSKPEIPPSPSAAGPGGDAQEKQLDPSASVGSLADEKEDDTSIDVGDSDKSEDQEDKKRGNSKAASGKKKSKIKVPNFEKFRLRIILGALALIILVAGFVFGLMVLPKATITISTDTSEIDTDLKFTADTDAQALDEENRILPAASKEFRRTDTEQVDASGEKNKGKKASGEIELVNCDAENSGSVTIPAGTKVQTGSLEFATTESVTLQKGFENSGVCQPLFPETVSVTAQKPGVDYNVDSGQDFSVSGYPNVEAENDEAMKGGTDNIVKVVTQADIDKGRQAIQDRANDTAAEDLQEELSDEGYLPIKETLVAGDPTITTDRKAGDEADSVTVTSTTVNTMLGVKREDLIKFIESEVSEEIDTNKQSINDNGLSEASFRVEGAQDGRATINIETTVIIGPDLDSDEIKKQIAGKNRRQTEDILKSWPDVSNVKVEYSPFWVSSTPGDAGKITIKFEDSK